MSAEMQNTLLLRKFIQAEWQEDRFSKIIIASRMESRIFTSRHMKRYAASFRFLQASVFAQSLKRSVSIIQLRGCCVENIIMNKEPLPMEGVSQDSDRGFFEEIAIRAGRES